MWLIEAFVHNPVKVAVGVLLVALFGFLALFRMPMQLTPEVEIPKISVRTRWPGASPEEVEREIVQEQEEQLQSVEGVTKMSAECNDSEGTITLEFKVGTDLSEALLKVNSRLQQVPEYPEEADEPVISSSDPNANAIAWFILTPRVASTEEVRAFLVANPDLSALLGPVARARSAGLRLRRICDLVAEHPEVKDRIRELMPPDIDVPKLRLFAEDFIEARFERVVGISNANVYGGQEEELQVIVDPQRLAARGLTIMDLRRALRQENRDVSAGDIWEGKRRYVVRTLGRFRSPEQVASVIVAHGDDGSPVYLRHVADVRLGFKKPTVAVRSFGSPCIVVNCIRETGANVLDTMAELRRAADEINRGLLKPRGLELTQTYDETDYIYQSIAIVNWNILYAALLTVVVLLLFLRSGRSTLVIALAIPTSIIGTFLLLNLMRRSLNVISLAGLAFAVGMLVDNAVVVLENIFRHHQAGKDPFAASVHGSKEVWGAVAASTLTTLAVFLPVLFVEEEAGQLFRDIALAISSAVGLSLIVSVTVIPTAAARLLKTRRRDRTPDERPSDAEEEGVEIGGGHVDRAAAQGPDGLPAEQPAPRHAPQPAHNPGPRAGPPGILGAVDAMAATFVHRVVDVNRFLQRSTLLRLGTVGLLVGLALGLSYLMMPKVEYLPSGNRNFVFGQLLPPPGYNLDQSLRLGDQLEQETKPYWDVDKDDPTNAKLDYPPIDRYFFVVSTRRVFFGMSAMEDSQASRLVNLLQSRASRLPGTISRVSQRSLFPRGMASDRSVDIEITGPDLPRLVELGQRIFGQVPGVVPGSRAFPIPSLDLKNPEVHVLRKSEQAADMGVSTDELGYTVDALIDGAYATDYFRGGDKIDLSIVGSEQFASRTQDLAALAMATPSGELARSEGIARLELAGGPEQINRRERQRAITISVMPPDEMPLEAAIDAIEAQIVEPLREKGEIGGEYQISLAGTVDKLRATWGALWLNVVLALLITYLLMAALFESWLYPFVIILSVPLGAVGGFAGLQLVNLYLKLWPHSKVQSLDVLTMLGFVILIGTVVNNAILIVHQSLNHMRHDRMGPNESILASVRTRIRPIFMTTSTTVLGLSPLVLFPGQGSELYRGLGAVVLGGLVVSTVFTLIFVPTLFSLMMDAKAGLARLLGFAAVGGDNPELQEPTEE